ncbi:MAG: hypothetical protein WCF23_22935 [Candidatus Nitrosopolaris sp.]
MVEEDSNKSWLEKLEVVEEEMMMMVVASPPANASWFPTIGPDANSNTTAAIDAMLRAMVVFGFFGYIDYVDL